MQQQQHLPKRATAASIAAARRAVQVSQINEDCARSGRLIVRFADASSRCPAGSAP